MITLKPASLPKLSPDSPGRTVPVWVDSRKKDPEFAMTRCAYFTIEREWSLEPEEAGESPGGARWVLELGEVGIPFGLQALTGVITGPTRGPGWFSSAQQIDETFDLVERHPELMVDSDDLWLPNDLVEGCHAQGMVYRLSWPLFLRAYSYEAGLVGEKDFLAWCREHPEAVSYSRQEEEAFAAWQKAHLRAAFEVFPKNKDLELAYRGMDAKE